MSDLLTLKILLVIALITSGLSYAYGSLSSDDLVKPAIVFSLITFLILLFILWGFTP